MKMIEACQWAAGEHRCDVDVEISENFRGYRVKPASTALAIAAARSRPAGSSRRALAAAAATPTPSACTASMRAALQRDRGGTTPPTRSLPLAELDPMLDVCLAAVAEAAGPTC